MWQLMDENNFNFSVPFAVIENIHTFQEVSNGYYFILNVFTWPIECVKLSLQWSSSRNITSSPYYCPYFVFSDVAHFIFRWKLSEMANMLLMVRKAKSGLKKWVNLYSWWVMQSNWRMDFSEFKMGFLPNLGHQKLAISGSNLLFIG